MWLLGGILIWATAAIVCATPVVWWCLPAHERPSVADLRQNARSAWRSLLTHSGNRSWE